jgi:uncharacterized protein DUF3631
MILNDVYDFLGRFIVYPSDEARVAHTLWVAHTHLMGEWHATPRLAFLAALPDSGKTTALEVTATLVPNALPSFNTTPAALVRSASDVANLPTFLVDEIDKVFEKKDATDIAAVFNAGYKRGATVLLNEKKGDSWEPTKKNAFAALAMAGIGSLPDTILSRSIIVRMKRRRADESVEYFYERDHEPEGHALRDRLAEWSETLTGIGKDRPKMPEGIINRNHQIWEPLLAIADGAGSDWTDRARVAAVALVALNRTDGSASVNLRLLSDLRTVFGEDDKLHTNGINGIINKLVNIEEAPWVSIDRGRPIDANILASLLKLFNISSSDVKIGGVNLKGYYKKDFHDAWERNLQEPPVAPTHTPGNGATAATFDPTVTVDAVDGSVETVETIEAHRKPTFDEWRGMSETERTDYERSLGYREHERTSSASPLVTPPTITDHQRLKFIF